MAALVQHSTHRDFWQALKELDFLSAFFSWLFMLFTRLSEPLMLLATLYVVAEAGVPSIALPGLHNLAVGIMITAPEIILPGAFVVASKAQEHATKLYVLCWIFVMLTLLTLLSLFVFHFIGMPLDVLMCARCAAAVCYSILMRIMSHRSVNREPVVQQKVVPIQLNETPTNVAYVKIKGIRFSLKKQSFTWVKQLHETEKEEPQKLVIEPVLIVQNDGQNGTQNEVNSESQKPIADEEIALLIRYPNIQSWLSTGQKTATLEEVIQVTGHTKRMLQNRLNDGTLKRSPRNQNLILISSVVEWLKVAPLPSQNGHDSSPLELVK